MTNTNCPNNGAPSFSCVMGLGSGTTTPINGTPPPPYCTTPAPNGLVYPNNGTWNVCSIVTPQTGVVDGSANGGTYGTGIVGGVSYICNNYANPYPGPTNGPTWVIALPLVNPNAFSAANGSNSPVDIVAFANFELDCPAMNNGATLQGTNTPFILGRFVQWICDTCIQGNPNGVETGFDTIILVQ